MSTFKFIKSLANLFTYLISVIIFFFSKYPIFFTSKYLSTYVIYFINEYTYVLNLDIQIYWKDKKKLYDN